MSRTSGNRQQDNGERYQLFVRQKKNESCGWSGDSHICGKKVVRLGREAVRS